MGSVFYGVESFLMDSFMLGEPRQSRLTDALLALFSPTRLPSNGTQVIDALKIISAGITEPFAAFAATAALGATRQPNDAGKQLVLETAKHGEDPAARALAIRVLGQQPRALLPLLDVLKERAVAPDSDPRVRRAALHALINTRQSGLPTRINEIIDLYFRYLTEAPFDHFGDALHGSDVAEAPQHFLARFSETFDGIKTQAALQAALHLVEKPFGFGIREEFEPSWRQVVDLMLRALDQPQHDELHYMIFWNMLNEVPIPEPAASAFATGLKDRLARLD
jgi:truncated hemoglobin YjbI